MAVDNSEAPDNANAEYVKNNFPEIDFKWAGINLGFAKAFNLMIARAVAAGAEYFLALNPDMTLEADMIGKMVEVMAADEKIAAVAPKILKWDFAANEKTDQIDSLGLALDKEHRFYDSHQGEIDRHELAAEIEVFRFTGAAVLLNLKALQDVAYLTPNPSPRTGEGGKEYFDELMFMYKEDCDLSYRLRLAGWKIILAPASVAFHDRAVASRGESNLAIALNRKNKSKIVKQWSFLNQWILLSKLKNLPFSHRVKFATAWHQFKSLVFVLLFEQYLLKELLTLCKLRDKISRGRRQVKISVGMGEIEKFMK